jgi:CRISPR associated protein Cas1
VVPLRSAIASRTIPKNKKSIVSSRASSQSRRRKSERRASGHAYAVLQSQIQTNAVAKGYDPIFGIMHERRDGSSAFIFDLMEPERPTTDRKVLEFIRGHVFDPADFVIRPDGIKRGRKVYH